MTRIIKSVNGDEINLSNVGIFYNSNNQKAKYVSSAIEKILSEHEINFVTKTTDEYSSDVTCAIVLGGDGTILKTARFYAPYDVPILGINLGRLGFLSQQESINEVVEAVLNGNYSIENRMMLSSIEKLALNDFVIKGCDPSRTSKFFLEINIAEMVNGQKRSALILNITILKSIWVICSLP